MSKPLSRHFSPELISHLNKLKNRDKKKRRSIRAKNKAAYNAEGRSMVEKKQWNFKKQAYNQKLYLIGCADFFKVGISVDPYKRLASLQTGNPHHCRLLAIWEPHYAPGLEKKIHRLLECHRVRGEWFSFSVFNHACELINKTMDIGPSFVFEPSSP